MHLYHVLFKARVFVSYTLLGGMQSSGKRQNVKIEKDETLLMVRSYILHPGS